MGDLREVRRLVAEVEAPSPEPEPLYPLASSVDAASASAAAGSAAAGSAAAGSAAAGASTHLGETSRLISSTLRIIY